MASLTVETGDLAGRQVEIGSERLVIGRSSSANLTLPTNAVSGQHCVIVPRGERYVLQDMDSTNGTRLNGSPIREARLKHGDLISLGDVDIRFEDAGGVDANVPPPAFAARKSRRLVRILVWVALGAVLVAAFAVFLTRLIGQ